MQDKCLGKVTIDNCWFSVEVATPDYKVSSDLALDLFPDLVERISKKVAPLIEQFKSKQYHVVLTISIANDTLTF